MTRNRLLLVALAGVAGLAGFLIAGTTGSDLVDEVGEVLPGPGTHAVTASVETEPVPSPGDAADDPAIWIDRDRPEA